MIFWKNGSWHATDWIQWWQPVYQPAGVPWKQSTLARQRKVMAKNTSLGFKGILFQIPILPFATYDLEQVSDFSKPPLQPPGSPVLRKCPEFPHLYMGGIIRITTTIKTIFLGELCGLRYLTLCTVKSSVFDVGRCVDITGLVNQHLSNFIAQTCHLEILVKSHVWLGRSVWGLNFCTCESFPGCRCSGDHFLWQEYRIYHRPVDIP